MLERVASYIWGTGLLVLLLGTGLCLSFRLRFFQFWGWKTILRRTFGSLRTKSGKGGASLTQFQTFSTALAAAMGTGNILGVAAALCLGGAGAIFWMWVSALLGMALTYSENVLALRYARTLPDGTKAGGPMAYLRFGLHSPVLAVFYSLCCIGASLGMGNMTQSSAISTLAAEAFSLPPLWTGIGVTLLLGIILLRGTHSTGKVIQWLMPVLSAVYLLAALGVIFRNAAALPAAFGQIFREAFGLHAVGGGISGAVLQRAVQTGLRHGIFSNEAGLGSSALVHAGGSSEDAQLQGMWSMVEVALDTLVCCTLTALAVLTSGAMTQADNAGGIISAAFSGVFGQAAPELMAGITALFAFCTLIGWCCCGEQAVRYSLLTDPCLSAGVREYVTGDPIHRMHWKASAHAGTLLMRQEERTARQTATVLLALESHRPDAGQMTPDSELLEHTIRVCVQCLWEFCSNGWQVRLCVGERNAKGNPIATPYGAGNTMYHRLLQQLAELQLQDVLSMPRLLSLSASRMTQETVLLITPYTDRRVARWKQQSGGLVLVTGHAHDSGNCADAVVPAPEYLRNGEAAL